MPELQPWAISGTYLESCNCEAICPCRRIGGVAGGRSTYGVCLGALSWSIQEGRAGEIDLTGLGVVLVVRYSDDEPGSPWTFVVYVDDRADESQHDALVRIFTGQLGGTALEQFPWAFKPSDFRAAVPARIEIDHTPGRGWLKAGDDVVLRISGPVVDQVPVTCVIPGHHHDGRELYAETLVVSGEAPLDFELHGNCAYESTFAYASDPV